MSIPFFAPFERGRWSDAALAALDAHKAELASVPQPQMGRGCCRGVANHYNCNCWERNFLDDFMFRHRPINATFVAVIVEEALASAAAPPTYTPQSRARLHADMLAHAAAYLETIRGIVPSSYQFSRQLIIQFPVRQGQPPPPPMVALHKIQL